MKGYLPDWFGKEIVNFFKTKHMSVEVINEDVYSYESKAEQCVINIRLTKKTIEQRAFPCKPVEYNVNVAHFRLINMPGCCGVVISTGAYVHWKLRNKGIGQFLHSIRIRLAKEWGYGLLMCSDIEENKSQLHILDKNGWHIVDKFTNPRTGNVVNLHTIKL